MSSEKHRTTRVSISATLHELGYRHWDETVNPASWLHIGDGELGGQLAASDTSSLSQRLVMALALRHDRSAPEYLVGLAGGNGFGQPFFVLKPLFTLRLVVTAFFLSIRCLISLLLVSSSLAHLLLFFLGLAAFRAFSPFLSTELRHLYRTIWHPTALLLPRAWLQDLRIRTKFGESSSVLLWNNFQHFLAS